MNTLSSVWEIFFLYFATGVLLIFFIAALMLAVLALIIKKKYEQKFVISRVERT